MVDKIEAQKQLQMYEADRARLLALNNNNAPYAFTACCAARVRELNKRIEEILKVLKGD